MSSFDFLLGRLPQNDCQLFSDASSLHGMGGGPNFWEIRGQNSESGRLILAANMAGMA